MYLTFAILCVFYVYFMCAAIGVIINDDDARILIVFVGSAWIRDAPDPVTEYSRS